MRSEHGPGLHIGCGPHPKTCQICREGCDWEDCLEPPTEVVTGHVVIAQPATLLDPATEDTESVRLMLCDAHAERARTEPVMLELVDP